MTEGSITYSEHSALQHIRRKEKRRSIAASGWLRRSWFAQFLPIRCLVRTTQRSMSCQRLVIIQGLSSTMTLLLTMPRPVKPTVQTIRTCGAIFVTIRSLRYGKALGAACPRLHGLPSGSHDRLPTLPRSEPQILLLTHAMSFRAPLSRHGRCAGPMPRAGPNTWSDLGPQRTPQKSQGPNSISTRSQLYS